MFVADDLGSLVLKDVSDDFYNLSFQRRGKSHSVRTH